MNKREKNRKEAEIGRCDSLIVEEERVPSQRVFTGMV